MDYQTITEIFSLPNTKNYKLLPEEAGIYFIVDGEEILYIGKATNLNQRGKKYSHYPLINKNILIYYLLCNKNKIDSVERKLIKNFNPKLNIALIDEGKERISPTILSRVPSDLYKSILLYCEKNETNISEKTRSLWRDCLRNAQMQREREKFF